MHFILLLLFLHGHSCLQVTSIDQYLSRKHAWRQDFASKATKIKPENIKDVDKKNETSHEINVQINVTYVAVDLYENRTGTNGAKGVGGFQIPGLRVKWGIGVPGVDCLYDIPRTVNDAHGQSWGFVPRPENAVFPALGMFCPLKDYIFCVLYDPLHGHVAGIQVAISAKVLSAFPDIYLEDLGFIKWINSEGEFWTTSQYFVSNEGPKAPKSDEILRENAIWIPDFLGTLMKISVVESDAPASGFVKQGCRMAVGRHYFYNMSESTKCTDILPWYLIYDSGVLVGSGFIVLGEMPKTLTERDWFETADMDIMKKTIPHGPKCLIDSVTNPGIITTKIYYIDQPYQAGWDSYCFE